METEVPRRKVWGGSLPVENVQALASNNLKEIPLRYLRPENEHDQVSVEDSLQIPVVDMSKLVGHDVDVDELATLHSACKGWGFFQLINHGVSSEVIGNMKSDTEKFFQLPLEEKKAHAQQPNHIEGYGQAFVVSQDQKLDWGDMLFLLSQPLPLRNLIFWPTLPTSFRETLNEYSEELQRLAINLWKLICRNLGIDSEKLARMFDDGTQGVRMNYYPPCAQASRVIGLTPHSDTVGLTLLIQVNEVQGLQIKKNGKWVPVKPVPGAFIVNICDIIEIMSNGAYKSIEHRAVANTERERLSIAAFHSPNVRTLIGPLPDLVKENAANYKTTSNEEYMKLVGTTKLDGKSLLDQMKLKQ